MSTNTRAHNALTKKGNLSVFTTIAAVAIGCLSANAQTSFQSSVDFTGLAHGTILDPADNLSDSAYLGIALSVERNDGAGLLKTVIFDTNDTSLNGVTQDPDLVEVVAGNASAEDFGSIAIIQTNSFNEPFTISADGTMINDAPSGVSDDGHGGTFIFDLTPQTGVSIDSFQFSFLDIENVGEISVFVVDANGSFTISGSQILAEQADIVLGDRTRNTTSFLDSDGINTFEGITQVSIISTTSFGIDNFKVSGTVVPEPSSSLLIALSSVALCFNRRRKN
ncbi:MAG: PEP-CTERM sorting domain-containing protein [Luteolibacter sp.]